MLSKTRFGLVKKDQIEIMIDKILSMWEDYSMDEIAKAVNIPKVQVSYYIGQLRKQGVDVPRKIGAVNDTIWKGIAEKYKTKYGEREIKPKK